MGNSGNEDSTNKKDFLPMEFLSNFYDHFEAYKIMADVFYSHVPDEEKTMALARVADRLEYELKDTRDEPKKLS